MIADDIKAFSTDKRVDELILSQYKTSPNLIKYIKAFCSPMDEQAMSMSDAINSRQIEQATGDALDKIAKTVGTSRLVKGAAALGYFGFKTAPTAEGLDVGIFYSYGEPTTGDLLLNDPALRRAIRAKIVHNTKPVTVETLIEFCELLLGKAVDLEITVPKSGAVHLMFHESLTSSNKAMLSVMMKTIKPLGVAMTVADNDGDIDIHTLYRSTYDLQTRLHKEVGE